NPKQQLDTRFPGVWRLHSLGAVPPCHVATLLGPLAALSCRRSGSDFGFHIFLPPSRLFAPIRAYSRSKKITSIGHHIHLLNEKFSLVLTYFALACLNVFFVWPTPSIP